MTIQPSETLIVIPAFNESAVLGMVLNDIKSHLPDFNYVVIDDGSSDGTHIEAEKSGVPVLRLPFNLGVGGAMRLGFKYAIQQGFQVVIQIDADGQHNPADVPALLSKLSSNDLVIGARFAGKGDYQAGGPRRWAMWVLSKSLSKVAKSKLTDTTSGFRASGPAAVKLFSENYPAEYLGDTVESLVIAARSGLRITQVPVTMRERQGGKPSQNPFKAMIYLVRATVALLIALAQPAKLVQMGVRK